MKHKSWLFGKNGAFFRAAVLGDQKLVEELARAGADINVASSKGFTPLHRAAQHGHIQTVEFLLREGADPSATAKDGSTPLSLAEQCGQRSISDLLRRKK
jgi:ankyrin repeat protein